MHRFRERAQQFGIVEPRDEEVVDIEKQPEAIALFAQFLLQPLRLLEERGHCNVRSSIGSACDQLVTAIVKCRIFVISARGVW